MTESLPDIKQIRRANLKHIVTLSHTQAEVAERIGVETQRVNALLSGRQNMGDKTARRIESVFGLKKNIMDHMWPAVSYD